MLSAASSISPFFFAASLIGGWAYPVSEAAASTVSLVPSTPTIEPAAFRISGIFHLAAAKGPSFGTLSAHADLLLIGAAILAAGAGAAAYLFRKRRQAPAAPSDGVIRSPSQKKALEEALRLEAVLATTDAKARRAAILSLLELLRPLAPSDRPARIQRLANQLCLDWSLIGKDAVLGHQIKNRIPRLPAPLLKQLTEALDLLRKNRQVVNISANADAIIRWIDGK